MRRRELVRAVRLAWPLLFIAPLWTLLTRLCWMSPAHLAIGAIVVLHEWLPALFVAAAAASASVVLRKMTNVRVRLATLDRLAATVPVRLARILDVECERLGMVKPALTYVDVATPICYTVAPGPTILISRGFSHDLSDDDLSAVIRHELVHVARRDPQRGLLWHLLFSALLVPGFGDLERWLYDRRERRADAIAGTSRDGRFADLSERVRVAESALEASLGNAYAGAFDRAPVGRTFFVKPALASALVAALLASHAIFVHALPGLTRHHC